MKLRLWWEKNHHVFGSQWRADISGQKMASNTMTMSLYCTAFDNQNHSVFTLFKLQIQ